MYRVPHAMEKMQETICWPNLTITEDEIQQTSHVDYKSHNPWHPPRTFQTWQELP